MSAHRGAKQTSRRNAATSVFDPRRTCPRPTIMRPKSYSALSRPLVEPLICWLSDWSRQRPEFITLLGGIARRYIMARPTLSGLFALTFLLVTASANPLAAQPFEGCPSREILAAFNAFASVGKPPPDAWRSWQRDPSAQAVEPWHAFDNIQSVGVCWVSAWAIRTSDGVVLIDTLHEPHVDRLVANLGKAGINLADIKYVLMTHGHFDHVGGAAKLKPLLINAKFVMTQAGWDEAVKAARKSEIDTVALVDDPAGCRGEGRRRHPAWRQQLRRA